VDTSLHTPIIPLIFNNIETVLKLQKLFLKQGIIVGAVRPPTVPNNSSRIRLTLNCELSKKELEPLIKTIKEWSSK
jgi:8-amino-7-oxononanoate synthase